MKAFFLGFLFNMGPCYLLFLYLLLFYFFIKNKYIINYIYIFKFIIFYSVVILYYSIYLIIYTIFFIFKQFRFFSYYFINAGASFYYYDQKSIYFLFWRYLAIQLMNSIYLYIIFCIYYIIIEIKNYYFINNIYIYIYIYIKTIIMSYQSYLKWIFYSFYNIYIYCLYHLFYIFNMEENYTFLSKLKFNIFKYINDPLFYRNSNLNLSSKYYYYYKNVNNNILLYFKNLGIIKENNIKIFKIFICSYIIYVFNILYIYNEKELKIWNNFFLSYFFLFNKIKKLNIILYFYRIVKIILFYLNLFILNFIYNILLYLIYFIYIIFYVIKILKKIIIILLLLFIIIKYYYIFLYYFFLLYKHYALYISLFDFNESLRFFNFECIDLRNYFNLIFLHNSVVPLIELNQNNIIYNNLLNNLNKTLSVYGFKVNTQYDVHLHSLLNFKNKDVKLLHNIFDVYKSARSYRLLKWYFRMKKTLTAKSKAVFQYHKKKKSLKVIKHLGNTKRLFNRNIKHHKDDIISHGGSDNSYFSMYKESLFRTHYKKTLKMWRFFNKKYFTKKTHKHVSPTTSYFIKLNKIPLRAIYVYHSDNYFKFKKNYLIWLKKLLITSKALKYNIPYGAYWLKQLYKKGNYEMYFNHIYHADNYNNELNYKHKIPTYQWTATRWRKKIPNHLYYSPLRTFNLLENQSWTSHYELRRKKIRKKRYYKAFFIKYKYPFCMNKNKNIMDSLNYNNVLNNYIKIIKKYYYIRGLKKAKSKRFYKHILYRFKKIISKLFLYRLQSWDKPFHKKQLGFLNNNFWYFFDYIKTDKYYYIKNNRNKISNNKDIIDKMDLNLFFLRRIRKDYIKLRNILLRYYSLFYRYNNLERAYFKHYFYNQGMAKRLKLKRVLWHYESFRTNWLLKLYFSKDKNTTKLFKKVKVTSSLFKKYFFAYFIYCDYTVNSYNDLYYIKIKNYKLRILNKINNLKRFFHFQNKHINGWSFFKYLNSFSFSYHIKHFLWHSPYSFLIFNNKEKNIFINEIKYNNNLLLNYIVKDYVIDINGYSIVFNLFLNIIEIKYCWYNNILQYDECKIINYRWFHNSKYNKCKIINYGWFHNKIFQYSLSDYTIHILKTFDPYNTFYEYYYCGHHNPLLIKSKNSIDIYRILMSFLFKYYENFLYRLTRYRYILDLKGYTIIEFIKRYINIEGLYKHFYLKFRTGVHYTMSYSKFIKKRIRKIFALKNFFTLNINKREIIPLWFIFDYYIKLFIYFLLNIYYTERFFIFYWLIINGDISYNKIILLYYYNYLYIMIYYIDKILYFFNYIYSFNIYIYFVIKYILKEIYIIKNVCFNFYYYLGLHLNKIMYITFMDDNNVHYNHIVLLIYKGLGFDEKNNKFMHYYYYYTILNLNKYRDKAFYEIVITIKWYLKFCFNYYDNSWLYNSIFFINKNKWILYNWFILKFNNIFEYNFNKIILIKIYLLKLLNYYLKVGFNLKNILIYFKPYYVYFRKQRGHKQYGKLVKEFRKAFTSTVTTRKIYSFKHLTLNINLFKNIYLVNIYNYIYLLNVYNYNNIFSLFFILFKNSYIFLNILFYLLLYYGIFIILFYYYKRFYNLFFFCESVNMDSQDNWERLFNNKSDVLTHASIYNKKINKIYKIVWLKNKNFNFYNFYFFNTFLNKLKLYNSILYKSVIINKNYNNLQYCNNNEILESTRKFLIWSFLKLNKYLKYFKNIVKMPFKLKKENKIYNFYFVDILNKNLLNFCMFYWLLLIPYFFFEYILMKYHLKSHRRIQRRWTLLLQLCLTKFKWYIKLYKIIGRKPYSGWLVKYPKTYKGIHLRNKKKIKYGYYFKWNKLTKTYIRMSTMGPYFYWFFKINKYEYFLKCHKYLFNFSYKSNYFYYIYVYIFILLLIKFKYKYIYKQLKLFKF